MKNAANFVLFQLVWFAAVDGAARGRPWLGPAALLAFLLVHLAMIRPSRERGRELGYLLGVGLFGALADSALRALGATVYPHFEHAHGVPPWIASLWIAFAMLPRFSLGWLAGRPGLAALFGAIGGPLSYFAGTRFGAVAIGDPPLLTWGALALEYALATPALLALSPTRRRPERA